MNIIGIGGPGCKIATELAKYPQYDTFFLFFINIYIYIFIYGDFLFLLSVVCKYVDIWNDYTLKECSY